MNRESVNLRNAEALSPTQEKTFLFSFRSLADRTRPRIVKLDPGRARRSNDGNCSGANGQAEIADQARTKATLTDAPPTQSEPNAVASATSTERNLAALSRPANCPNRLSGSTTLSCSTITEGRAPSISISGRELASRRLVDVGAIAQVESGRSSD